MKISLFSALALAAGLGQAYIPVPYQTPSDAVTPPSRKDITTMGTEEFNLFILAMRDWQKAAANNVGGYFQVVGIHGAPHQYWDNAGGYGTTSTGNKNVGYCFHGDQNFYLWHRPYLALFEQQMRATALNISSTWYQPQRSAYQAAANNLRLPYWDWAKGGQVPSSITSQQITVVDPTTGQSITIQNPLYSHTLVSGSSLGGPSVGPNGGRTTYRRSSYASDMANAASSLQRGVALLFNTANVCWNVFATYNTNQQSQCTGTKNINSLEGIHNTVHNTIAGTMASLDTSAFDPIFWLHHANVDRIGAIWQGINPNTKVVATQSSGTTFVAGAGTRDETFTYLPFRTSNANTAWWRVNQAYDVRTSGYTYPEIADRPSSSTLLSRVNAIYGTGRSQQSLSSTSSKRDVVLVRQAVRDLDTPPTAQELEPYKSTLIQSDGSFDEYTVACTVRKSVAPGTSFDLHLFFGNVDGTDYRNAPNRVGGFSVSQGSGSEMDTAVSGMVQITDALLNTLIEGKIKDMKPDTVRKFIRARLVWRMVTADGEDIGGKARNNGLKVKVQHSVVKPAAAPVVAAAASGASSDARPTVAAPEDVLDTTEQVEAQAVPADVVATTLLTAATSAATGA